MGFACLTVVAECQTDRQAMPGSEVGFACLTVVAERQTHRQATSPHRIKDGRELLEWLCQTVRRG